MVMAQVMEPSNIILVSYLYTKPLPSSFDDPHLINSLLLFVSFSSSSSKYLHPQINPIPDKKDKEGDHVAAI